MTIGSLFDETWRFIRANLSAIAIWSLLSLGMAVLMRWGLLPFYQAQLQNTVAQAQGLPPSLPPFGRFFLVWLGVMLFYLVLYNAVFRAVLFPEQRGFAYLKVGMDELRLLGLILILWLAVTLVEVAAILVILVVGVAFGLTAGLASPTGGGGFALVMLLLFVPLWLAGIFVMVRLIGAPPLTLLHGKIAIGPAWRLTKGHFWRLFGAGVIVFVVVAVISFIVSLPMMGPMIAAMGHPQDPDAQIRMAQVQVEQLGNFWSPIGLFQILFSVMIGGPLLAVLAGMPAIAVRQLLAEQTPQPVGTRTGAWDRAD